MGKGEGAVVLCDVVFFWIAGYDDSEIWSPNVDVNDNGHGHLAEWMENVNIECCIKHVLVATP